MSVAKYGSVANAVVACALGAAILAASGSVYSRAVPPFSRLPDLSTVARLRILPVSHVRVARSSSIHTMIDDRRKNL